MRARSFVPMLFLAGMFLGGCGKGGAPVQDPANPAYDALNTGFGLSREMASADRALIRNDVVKLSKIQLKDPGDQYDAIFGGHEPANVLEYLKERVHYFISQRTDITQKIEESGRWEPLTDQSQGVLMARNLGIVLWLNWLTDQPREFRYVFDDSALTPNDPRFGLIQLGPGYSPDFPELARITTIVHEARHSDCTGGLPKADLDRIRADKLPQGRSCGHLHIECPPGHELAGMPACDAHAWGAYSVDYFWSSTIAKSCANCSELERQQAMALAADSASRILVFSDMVSGKLGLPDMSSVSEVQ